MATDQIIPRPMVLEEFKPYLEKLFVADCTPKNVDLTLVEAYPLKDRGVTERPPFMLIFHTDRMTLLIGGIYTLRSGRFGPAAVYLEPIASPPGSQPGYFYQAVFN